MTLNSSVVTLTLFRVLEVFIDLRHVNQIRYYYYYCCCVLGMTLNCGHVCAFERVDEAVSGGKPQQERM